MSITREFKKEQRLVALEMIGALVVTFFVLGVVATTNGTIESTSFVSRLQFALRTDVVVVFWLTAAIANVARIRFFSEQDIAGSGVETGSEEVRIGNAILQNTIEQVVLAIFTYSIVAATFNRSSSIIVALVCLFSIGRFLFWIGYKYGAKGRAFGFALTFYPNALVLLASATAALLG